jgi:carbamoyltransferase
MRVLGINDGHSASAALVEDGRVLAAVQEERLTRVKNQGGLPALAIAETLRISQTAPAEIDAVAFCGRNLSPRRDTSRDAALQINRKRFDWRGHSFARQVDMVLRRWRYGLLSGFSRNRRERRRERLRQERCRTLAPLGIEVERVEFIEHHLCHAAAAYYGQGCDSERILVLTADGAGDGLCATAQIAEAGQLEPRLVAVSRHDSPAMLYALITFYLGFVPLEHEYKLMGMAPYVAESAGAQEVRDFLASLIPPPAGDLDWRRSGRTPPMAAIGPLLERGLRFHRFDDIAAGLQEYTEQFYLRWVRNLVRSTGVSRLALAGGLFMNVKLNKLIMELPEVSSLFVFPSCGDESNSVGAAYALGAQLARDAGRSVAMTPAGPAYWGPEASDHEVERLVEAFRFTKAVRVSRSADIEAECAERLARGQIIARFKGRMEFGARALGNRSILSSPHRWETVRVINMMIKKRDFWMPFAPSILAEEANRYLINPKGFPAPYMVLAFDSRPAARDSVAAAVHPYDGSCRPQIVEREWNPDYHRLLRLFRERTGHGAVLNTSFNLHGLPIVCTPTDALEVFDRSGLECLALNHMIIEQA